MELKDRLKLARKNAGITQAKVAEAITGLSQPAYSELERGVSKSTSKIVELASLYKVNPEWLSSFAPHTGAWIETCQSTLSDCQFLFAPHTGAWIETHIALHK